MKAINRKVHSSSRKDKNDVAKTMDALFRPRPRRWGLRGDPFLWDELSSLLAHMPLPVAASQFVGLIERSFLQLTGHPFSSVEPFFVERLAHGGMSSGHVSPEFWRLEALPLLLRRYERSRLGGEA